MLIDYQAHWWPRAVFESLIGRSDGYPRAERDGDGYLLNPAPGLTARFPAAVVDLERHFEDMDRTGVDVMVSSPSSLGDFPQEPPGPARERCDILNEAYARAQQEHPERFRGLVTLPWQHPQLALEVLEDGIGRLGLTGVALFSNVGGRPVSSPELWPVYARIEQLGVPIVLHPSGRSVGADPFDMYEWKIDASLGWIFDTSQAALCMIVSGLLDRHPGLRVVHPHLGGFIPFVVGRIVENTGAPMLWYDPRRAAETKHGDSFEEPIEHYLRHNFYVDTGGLDAGALQLAVDVYGADRVVFGSDYPWRSREAAVEYVHANVDAETAATITTNEVTVAPARA